MFRATLEMTMHNKSPYARVSIDGEVVSDLGLRPGDTLRASVRGTEFTGKVHDRSRRPVCLCRWTWSSRSACAKVKGFA